ncbi:MAG: metallopeptidase family protein [Planctomycetota bacterium]
MIARPEGARPDDDLAARREEIWTALEESELAAAHEMAQRLNPPADDYEGQLLVAIVHQETGHPKEAYEILGKLAAAPLDGDMEFTRRAHLAECAYALGQPQEALDLFYTLEPDQKEERAQLLWARGLCYDHLGRTKRADRCFAEAQELVPEYFRAPISITPEETEALVTAIAEQMPAQLRQTFEEVPIVIQDLPSLETIVASGGEVHPDTLGLYTGAHLQERSHLDPGGLPPTIYIFRRNLERISEDREALEEQIRITLLHELGHHLGFEEDDLDEYGLA